LPTDTDKVADLALARQRQRQAATETKAEADAATHHTIALSVCAYLTEGEHAPVYANGAFYSPGAGGLWRQMSHERLQVMVAELHGGKKLCKKHSDFKQIVEHLAALIEAAGFFDEAPLGVVSPGGFHRLTPSGSVETIPLDLSHRQTFALPFAPDYQAEAPLLDGVLAQAFEGDDPQAQTDLWWQAVGASMFGLMPRLQTVVLMLGRERSGKSLLQRVLERAFPAEAVGAVSPASWGHEYHVAALGGKRVNVVGELSDDAPIPAAPFKNVTGQNLVAGRHPTHRPFSFRCQAAHWFASNVLPPTTDRSEAFYRRWRVLRFANTVPADRVDPGLFEKIMANEMPAVLASAFMGAERVARAGALPTTGAHGAVLDRWRLAANPLQQFLTDAEWVEIDASAAEHTTPTVYEAYRRWSTTCGFRNPFGRNHFLELLDSTGATRGVGIKRIGTKNVVAGLRLVPRDLP
jgi:putative DNA primase/helicase